jgi:hypothetical protein
MLKKKVWASTGLEIRTGATRRSGGRETRRRRTPSWSPGAVKDEPRDQGDQMSW